MVKIRPRKREKVVGSRRRGLMIKCLEEEEEEDSARLVPLATGG